MSIDGVGVDELEHQAFRLDEPAALALDAAGSYEEAGSPASDTTLAATVWIVRREDGVVVWRLRPPRPARGTFVSARDTVRLPAGLYDAYVASYGDPLARAPAASGRSLGERLRTALNRSGRAWRGDAGRWRLIAESLGGAATRVSGDPDGGGADSSVVWRASAVRSRERRETLFQVTAPARVRLRALVEVADGVLADSAVVVRLGTRDTVWVADPERTTWAGGSLKNRLAADEVALDPGFYQAVYTADRDHAYGSWTANPPWAPWQWGMEVRGGAAVRPLDATALDLPEVDAIRCAGPNEDLEQVFTLDRDVDALVVAVGEVVDGSRYDWGGLDRETEGREWDEVWEMPRRGLDPAGGDAKNRRATAALSLSAGTYRLRYEADTSHDCASGYNGDGGPEGDLWGVALYAFDPEFDPASVRRPAPPPGDETVLAEVEGGGAEPFSLDADAAVVVDATGVLTEDDASEVAWITDADGATVWTLTWDTAEPVGSLPFVRRFGGRVRLPAGDYTLRYREVPTAFEAALSDEPMTGQAAYRGVRVIR